MRSIEDDQGRPYRYVLFENPGASDLVVHFSAFTSPWDPTKGPRSSLSYYFHRLKLLGSNTDHNWLFVCDEYGAERNGTYYTGEKGDFFVERAITKLIVDTMSKLGVGPDRVITIGSSMGGTGALKLGLQLGVAGIVALSPHIDLDVSALTQGREPHVRFLVPDGEVDDARNHPYTRQIRRSIEGWERGVPLPRLFLQTCQDDHGVFEEQVPSFVDAWRDAGGEVTVDARATGGHNSPHATRPLLLDVLERLSRGEPIDVGSYQREPRFQVDAGSTRVNRLRNLTPARAWGGVVRRGRRAVQRLRTPKVVARARLVVGHRSLSYRWGMDRGVPVDRHYLEACFLEEFRSDIRGHCLEFGRDVYATRFGGAAVTQIDVLTSPGDTDFYSDARIVADLTKPNQVPSDVYDCILCTHVINMVLDFPAMLRELHRILRPGGVLLIATPHVSMHFPKNPGLFRFTPEGLRQALRQSFGDDDSVTMRSYGNSRSGAALLRGVVAKELPRRVLDYVDDHYPVEVCARAVKPA